MNYGTPGAFKKVAGMGNYYEMCDSRQLSDDVETEIQSGIDYAPDIDIVYESTDYETAYPNLRRLYSCDVNMDFAFE